MSAIAKPLVKFANSLTPTVVVNADNIASIEKINIPAQAGVTGSKARYGILITYVQVNSGVKNASIYWAVQATRDTDFTTFETLVAATIS